MVYDFVLSTQQGVSDEALSFGCIVKMLFFPFSRATLRIK